MRLTEIADGLAFPEGPIALEDGSFLVVEIAGERLTHVGPSGKLTQVAKLPGGPNGAALGPGGTHCYICNHGGTVFRRDDRGGWRPGPPPTHYRGGRIERVELATGKVELLYDSSGDGRLNAPNDIVFDAHGGFYFTDMGKTHERHLDRGAVYYAAADGSFIRKVVGGMLTPNGIGLSPDQTVLFVAETQTGRLWSWPIAAPGQVVQAEGHTAHGGTFLAGSAEYRMFDSMAIEAGGNICVATLFKGGITIFDPTGATIDYVPTGDIYTTNLCFGGGELRTAIITLSYSGRLVAIDWPRAGLPLAFAGTMPGERP